MKMRKLISIFGTPEKVLAAPIQKLKAIAGFDQTAENIKTAVNYRFVENQMEAIEKNDCTILTYWDKNYPEKLKNIYDPPAFLFLHGNVELLDTKSIGIVGSRLPTQYGKMVTQKLSTDLAESGLTIVSGFARGIDTIAHQAALKVGGNTIAVLGNGLDIVYPIENKKLIEGFEQNGLFVSEYPFGTKPDAADFPKRNRIISALSFGILITEAGKKSGSLLTAMYALDQNREIFATPGPINSANSIGTNNLIQQGAKLVTGIQDIISEISGQLSLGFEEKKVAPEPKLNGSAKVIYNLLDTSALHIDQLAIKADISISAALTTLLTLELNGHIKQMAGKMFCRI